jgi:hypothetical protein
VAGFANIIWIRIGTNADTVKKFVLHIKQEFINVMNYHQILCSIDVVKSI